MRRPRKTSSSIRGKHKMLPNIQKILDYMNSNLDRTLTLDDLAGSANLSKSRMRVLFRAQIDHYSVLVLESRSLYNRAALEIESSD